jgi:transposase
MDLTDKQWALLEPLLSGPKKWKPGGRGRPPQPARAVLNGILWVMRTGAPWHDIPGRYPPYSTCFRRFEQWRDDGTLKKVLTLLYDDLRERGKVDDVESFIDGTYSYLIGFAHHLTRFRDGDGRAPLHWARARFFDYMRDGPAGGARGLMGLRQSGHSVRLATSICCR